MARDDEHLIYLLANYMTSSVKCFFTTFVHLCFSCILVLSFENSMIGAVALLQMLFTKLRLFLFILTCREPGFSLLLLFHFILELIGVGFCQVVFFYELI